MLSGRRLDLLDPSPLDVEIEDIALGLSRVARWNGQTIGPHGFSVAQHAVLVADLVGSAAPPGLQLAALLHDASEYVTSDLITPFKAAIGPAYKALEKRVEAAVFLRFGLPAELPETWTRAIKAADRVAAFIEATQIAGFAEAEARRIFAFKGESPAIRLDPTSAETARRGFLRRFESVQKLCTVRGPGLPATRPPG